MNENSIDCRFKSINHNNFFLKEIKNNKFSVIFLIMGQCSEF